ncbi:MAG: hypothetical protein U0105_01535 [Candidatus Obscuribacterales bacterium]
MKLQLKTLLIVAATVSMSAPAFAQFAKGSSVTMGNQPVFNLQAGGGFTSEKRAWITQDRLDNALVLSNDKSPSAVTIDRRNGAIIVTLGGREVVTASSEGQAQEIAGSIKNFLSDSSRTEAYIAQLNDPNPVASNVAVLERRLFLPANAVLPLSFLTEVNSETAHAGDRIEAVLTSDYAVGGYVVPQGAKVIGFLHETEPGAFLVSFSELKMPTGTVVPITATLTHAAVVEASAPKAVCTLGLPAGPTGDCRHPSTIAIGGLGGPGAKLIVRRGTNMVIAAGQPFGLLFERPTSVAVVVRETHM